VAIAPLFFVLFAVRTRIEEREMIAGLPGYADYAARVRYRLLPGGLVRKMAGNNG
jgi:protein-S-isoprenylcysteine O-methyltransferase Ste14